MLDHVECLVHQYSPLRAALNPFSAQLVLVLGIALTPVQDLALGLVGLCVHMDLSLKLVKVSLDGIQRVECTAQPGFIGKLAEGTLGLTAFTLCKLPFCV